MKLRAEVLEPGVVTASVLDEDGNFPIRDVPMTDLGHNIFQVEFDAKDQEYVLLVDLNGVRHASAPFWGEVERLDEVPEVVAALTEPEPPKDARFSAKPRKWVKF